MAHETIEQEIELTDAATAKTLLANMGETDAEVEIQIEDDRPEDDRNKPTAHDIKTPPPEGELKEPPADASADEREQYATGVQQRINELTFRFNAERRAREDAERQAQAALGMAKGYMEELKTTQGVFKNNEQFAIAALKDAEQRNIDSLTQALVKATGEADAESMVKIQKGLYEAQAKLMQLTNYQPAQLREPNAEKDWAAIAPQIQPSLPPEQAQKSAELNQAWLSRNPWFNSDQAMSAYALAVDKELQARGVNPLTDAKTYYTTIDKQVRTRFADYPWLDRGDTSTASPPPVVTAATSRAPSHRKNVITLTRSELVVASKMGLTPKQYALEKQKLNRGKS